MFSLEPLNIVIFVFFITIFFLIFFTLNKMQIISGLHKTVANLEKTLNDLDQQARLIIKNDMELKLYQQEIENKFDKLTLISNLILASLPILDKEMLFSLTNKKFINSLGFRKGIILDFNTLNIIIQEGFSEEEIQSIKNGLRSKKELFKNVSMVSPESEMYKHIFGNLYFRDLVATPIRTSQHMHAIFIVSELLIPTDIKKTEEKAFLITSMYLGQCLDKITLFEELYHSKDDLEKKIKERTNELVKSLRKIEVVNKAKSDFISSVSHELRTPLTSVKGFSSLLVDEKFGKLSPEAKRRLIKIDENVDKLMDIVNTLLDISRIESGKTEVKIAPYDISKLIKDVCDFLTPQTQEKNLTLEAKVSEGMNVYMDKNLIERVLINLINNALKFTPNGGSITVGCKKDDNHAIISVADTGMGIKKEDLEKIFQEFFRVSNAKIQDIRGSGLGLSLVKRIIDTHKEKIWVESEFGKGTTFHFTLKLA
ncbi:MAG: hypothetical protein GF375_03770 [Candidatus Omnitrophica bacterium]|nr:hypothetical protein [Candidatus Omnitrophota bacterium]MBD3269178.1 hypothetical protein [Candidatus Omnitrophota bacterium]